MTITLDMTMLALIALVAGIAAFIAPRLLGLVAGVALVVFAIYQLYPEIRTLDLAETIEKIDFSGIQIEDHATPANRPGDAG